MSSVSVNAHEPLILRGHNILMNWSSSVILSEMHHRDTVNKLSSCVGLQVSLLNPILERYQKCRNFDRPIRHGVTALLLSGKLCLFQCNMRLKVTE